MMGNYEEKKSEFEVWMKGYCDHMIMWTVLGSLNNEFFENNFFAELQYSRYPVII